MRAVYLVSLRLLYVCSVTLSYHGTSGSYVSVAGVGSYALHEETKTYSGAVQKCQEEGAHLAVINSEAEENVLMTLFRNTSVTEAYVGLNDIAMEGFWVTVFGELWSSVGYSKWGRDQPDRPWKKEDCAALDRKTQSLHDYGCNDFLSFFCEMKNKSTFRSNKGPANGVTFSDEYVTVPGVGSYRFHVQQAAYSEAAEICESEEAHLVVINSIEEEDVMINFLDGTLQSEAFVGVNDMVTEGRMVTVLGEPLDSVGFYRWESGFPRNRNGVEHCVIISKKRKLNDVMCGERHSFLCEKYNESFPKSVRIGGYVTVPGIGSYILHDHSLSYKMATRMCENEGAHLATINSKDEEDVLMKLLGGSPRNMAFIGLNDIVNQGDTVTVLGWSKVGNSKWASSGEPEDAHNMKGCVAIGKDRLLKDLKCALKMAYFCEKNTSGVISSAQAPAFSTFTIFSIYIFLYLIKIMLP